ncbi:MAG: radical SAM protein [Candidatus Omnitrophota bacterium]
MPYKYPKVLLINAPDYNDRRGGEPLGLGYLSAFLKKHAFTCDILDGNSAGPKKISRQEIVKIAARKKYDLVGMAVYTHIFYNTLNLAKDIKKRLPKTKMVLGGHHATFSYKELLRKYPFVDFIVRGEGELTLLELARRMKEKKDFKAVKGLVYRSGKNIIVNPPRPLIKDLNRLPYPERDESRYRRQPKRWRGASLISSRGCPYRCSFCSISAFYKAQPGTSYRMRSPSGIAKEIESLVKKFNIKQVAFKDDNMFVDAKRLVKVTDILTSKGISLKYNIIARPDNIVENEKYIPVLKKRGFTSCEVGIEAGSVGMLKRYRKDVSVNTNRKAVEILRKNDMNALLDLIMFEPDMTLQDFRENIDFVKELGITPFLHHAFIFGSLLHSIDLHPGTAYYERMRKEGRLKGGIFRPRWDFKDKNMQKIYKFVKKYKKTLRKRIRTLKKLRREKLIELNIKKRDDKTLDDRLGRAELKHLDYDIDRVYLELLDKALTIGKRFNFSDRGFSEVKKSVEKRLKTLKEKILTTT